MIRTMLKCALMCVIIVSVFGCATAPKLHVPIPTEGSDVYLQLAEAKEKAGDYGAAFAAYLQAQEANPSLLEEADFVKDRNRVANLWNQEIEAAMKGGE